MTLNKRIFIKNIVVALLTTMFFSCKNSNKEINDFLADKNLPIGVAKTLYHVYKDSGVVTSKMSAPLFYDYSNRKDHPYAEFPKGVKIVSIAKKSRDSVTVTGDYAISYTQTSLSEIIGNVVVVNHTEGSVMETKQMYWDQKANYFFTKHPFVIYTEQDTLRGVGFESDSSLRNWILSNTEGDFIVEEIKD